MVRSHFICFYFQKTFHNKDFFCTLSHFFVQLGFRLLSAYLAVPYFAVYLVSESSRQVSGAPYLKEFGNPSI